MDDVATRLRGCFELVFPELAPQQIHTLNQSEFPAWDSIASINLLNVIEEEFGIEIDFEQLGDLDSYDRVCTYVTALVNVER